MKFDAAEVEGSGHQNPEPQLRSEWATARRSASTRRLRAGHRGARWENKRPPAVPVGRPQLPA